MICYVKNKTNVNHIMSDEDTATSIVSIKITIISSSHVKQSERTRISRLFPQELKNLNHIFEDHVAVT